VNEAPPAAPEHDPRLDEGGEDHPLVLRGPFDLIALENTRLGLKAIGAGCMFAMIGLPLYLAPLAGTGRPGAIAGSSLHLLGLVAIAGGALVCAPTPNGPLPRWLKSLYVLACAVAAIATVDRMVPVVPVSIETWVHIRLWIERASGVLLLALPWILWRFCQHRGLTGRALTWIWVGMATAALALPLALVEARWFLWLVPPLGVLTWYAAMQTSRDVWLDAVYRNTRSELQNLNLSPGP
jgi:hypothetical protein